MVKRYFFVLLVVLLAQPNSNLLSQQIYEINSSTTYVTAGSFSNAPGPGDTVKILAPRDQKLKIAGISGDASNPVVFINSGGQVNITNTRWAAIEFKDCKFIKVSGTGDPNVRYGFTLLGKECGLGFTGLSSDCEAEFIEIIGGEKTFFGIYAKKDYGGNPPVPYPQFNNLIIHDMYIHGVSAGMYIGETKTPGMEFHHVKVYNNIITDTQREALQIANCVEDVEINNNLMMNSGLGDQSSQSNILQIGGNSVAKVNNNILVNGIAYGMIVLGMGDIEVLNNYSENNLGVFIDNRYWTLDNTAIKFNNNYFYNQSGTEVFKNMNEFNDLYLTSNQYNTDITFFNNSNTPPVCVVENNSLLDIEQLNFTIENGIYLPDQNNSASYEGMGPVYPMGQVVDRIVLSKDQVSDLVHRGSDESPEFLVDEQDMDPTLDQHPISHPWIPKRNYQYAPYHTEIDLGSEYYLESIYLHHVVKNKGKLIVSALIDGEWVKLFTDPCRKRNAWNHHMVEVSTQFLRLSIYDKKGNKRRGRSRNKDIARINEIALYGYSLDGSGMKSESGKPATKEPFFPETKLGHHSIYPNPASDCLNISYSEGVCTSEIIGISGKVLISSKEKLIDLTAFPNGMYFVRLTGTDNHLIGIEKLIISK